MNARSKVLVWVGLIVGPTLIAALAFNPAVILGTIIGVTVMTMKQISEEKDRES